MKLHYLITPLKNILLIKIPLVSVLSLLLIFQASDTFAKSSWPDNIPVPPFSTEKYPLQPVTASDGETWSFEAFGIGQSPSNWHVYGIFDNTDQSFESTPFNPSLQQVVLGVGGGTESNVLKESVSFVSYICVSGEGAPFVDVAVHPTPANLDYVKYLGWNGEEFSKGVAANINGNYWYRLEAAYNDINRFTFYAKTYRKPEGTVASPFKIWAFTQGGNPLDGKIFKIKTNYNNGTSAYLGIDENQSGTRGARLTIWNPSDSKTQQWKFEATGKDTYRIKNQGNTSYPFMDADLATIGNNGSVIHLWSHTGAKNQEWKVTKNANGTYNLQTLEPRGGNRFADLALGGNVGKNGGIIHLWQGTGATNQQWILEEASSENQSDAQLAAFYSTYGGKDNFTSHYVDAVTTFIKAEDAVNAGHYAEAKETLDELWAKYPIGDEIWRRANSMAQGTFIGNPVAYNGLLMLTDVVNYHVNPSVTNIKPYTVNMKVVLAGHSEGIMPRSIEEMTAGTGVTLRNELDPRLRQDNYKAIKRLLNVFNKYIHASTNGILNVDVQVIELPDFVAETVVNSEGPQKAGHKAGLKNYGFFQSELSSEVKDDTDWWWVIYPSFVPGTGQQSSRIATEEAFAGYGFITGGMGGDYKGAPVFIIDDLFFFDKQPILSADAFTEIERRCYAPNWLQHEFFHYLYNIFPSFENEPNGLEPNGHDWQKPRSVYPWPSDFNGIYESDYYQESMHKRIKRVTSKPLHIRLRKRVQHPPMNLFAQLNIQDVLGNYEAPVVHNDWNLGSIIKEDGKYFWKNKAGIVWEVVPDLAKGKLLSTSESDYSNGVDFTIILKQDDTTGEFLPVVEAISHGPGLLIKK